MILGGDYFYKCPSCGNMLRNGSLVSGNTCGAIFYSDGRCIAPMLPDIPDLTKCVQCDAILWLSDLEIAGEGWGSENPEWSVADSVRHLELQDLWRALEELQPTMTVEREIFIRQRIWWKYNINGFETIDEMNEWRQNCFDLLDLLDLTDYDNCCMATELRRNLCEFTKCMALLNKLPEEYNHFRERIIKECNNGNPLTVNINEDSEEIEEDGVQQLSPENGSNDTISARLAEKIEQDEETAKNAIEFYTALAENCNAEAQYALAKLYLDERFYNQPAAINWMSYAAYQGHKAAIAELEDFEMDDDGRYDAWA